VPTPQRVSDLRVAHDGHQWGFFSRGEYGHGTFTGTKTVDELIIDETKLEQPVVANRGRFQSIIGYVDVLIEGSADVTYHGHVKRRSLMMGDGGPSEEVTLGEFQRRTAAVEVKARITSFGDLVRQIQRYRHEWVRGEELNPYPDKWVVLSPSVTESLRRFLLNQDIIGIRPSPQFLPWCAQHGLRLPADARALLHEQLALSMGEGAGA
jgi:hypothetical protein